MDKEGLKTILGEVEVPDDILAKISEATEKEVQDAHSGVTNKTLTDVDARISELFGIEKQSGEKTTDLIDRAAKAYKDKVTQQHQSEANELKKQLKEAKANGAKPEELQKLQEALVAKEKEVEEKKTEYDTELAKIKRDSIINQIKSKIDFDPNLDAELTRPYIDDADRKAREVKTVTIADKVYASEDGVVPIVKNDKNILYDDYVMSLYGKLTAKPTPPGNSAPTDAGQTGGTDFGVGDAKTKFEAMKQFNASIRDLNTEEQRAKRTEFKGTEAYQSLPSN